MPSARSDRLDSRHLAPACSAARSGTESEIAARSALSLSVLMRIHEISATRLGHADSAAHDDVAYVGAQRLPTVGLAGKPLPLRRALLHRRMYEATLRAVESIGADEVRRLEDEEIRHLEMDWFASQIGALMEESDFQGGAGGADAGFNSCDAAPLGKGDCHTRDLCSRGISFVTDAPEEWFSNGPLPAGARCANFPTTSEPQPLWFAPLSSLPALLSPSKAGAGDWCPSCLSAVQLGFRRETPPAKLFGGWTRGVEHRVYYDGPPSCLPVDTDNLERPTAPLLRQFMLST